MPLINGFGSVRAKKDNSMRIKQGWLERSTDSALRLLTIISDGNTSKRIRRIPLSDSKVAEGQRDKTKNTRANEHFRGTRQHRLFLQEGRKGYKEGFSISDLRGLGGLAVNFLLGLCLLV